LGQSFDDVPPDPNQPPQPSDAYPNQQVETDIKDLAGGALVNFIGKLGRLSRGGFIWVVTLLCGLEVLGLYSLAWAIVSTCNKIARFGLQRGLVRFVVRAVAGGQEPERYVAAAVLLGLMTSCPVALGVFFGAPFLADFYDKPIAGAIRTMAFSAPFMTLTWIFMASLRARRIMRFGIYVMSVGGPLILFAGGLAVGLAEGGIGAIAWVQLSMSVGVFLLSVYYFSRFYSLPGCLRALGGPLPWGELARFSWPIMLTDLLYSVLVQLDSLMLGWFVSAQMVGLYSLARRIASAMLKAPQAFDPIFSSIVSELVYRRQTDALGHRFVVISRWILTLNLPIFVALLLVGDRILPLMTRKEDGLSLADLETSFTILVVLCIGMAAQGLFAIIEPLLAMGGRPRLNLYNNLAWVVTNFSLNIWLIESMGIEGAAWGATLSMLGVNIIRLWEVWAIHRVQPFRRSQLKPLAAAAVATAVMWGVNAGMGQGWESLFGALAAFVAVYVLFLALLGLEAEDRALLRRLRSGGASIPPGTGGHSQVES
jgi:O-antigen/teichoic acid export membrane protein